MAIKGYLNETGMAKVRSFISAPGGVRHAILNLGLGNENQQINLVWNGPANQNFLETTNSIANNNEILFRIGNGITMGNLSLNFSDPAYTMFGLFQLDGSGEIVYSDNVILYNKIRLTFAYKTTDI